MKQEYNRLFDKITSDRSDGQLIESVLRKAENMDKRSKFNKKAVIIPVAAAMLLSISAVGVSAAFGSNILANMFGTKPGITDNIQKSVFEDSTEHIIMTVDEYLTDTQTAHMTVHYEALTAEGADWLQSYDFSTDNLNIKPAALENYEVSYSYCADEAEELTTDASKTFYVCFEASSSKYGSDEAEFNYPLPDGIKTTTLSTLTNVNTRNIKLSDEASPSEHFTPTYITLTDLGFTIYGENISYYEEYRNEYGYTQSVLLSKEESDKLHEDFVFGMLLIMEDGSKIALTPDGGFGAAEAHEENFNSDFIIAYGTLANPIVDGKFTDIYKFHEIVDIDDVSALEICGVTYQLTDIK